MKLDHPIQIDMREFLTTGRFDFLELGQTKEWILRNFPDPDDTGGTKHNIWRYGVVELHFADDTLNLIYSDYLEDLHGGPSLNIEPWFLREDHTLQSVIELLNRERLSFRKELRKAFHYTSTAV